MHHTYNLMFVCCVEVVMVFKFIVTLTYSFYHNYYLLAEFSESILLTRVDFHILD